MHIYIPQMNQLKQHKHRGYNRESMMIKNKTMQKEKKNVQENNQILLKLKLNDN